MLRALLVLEDVAGQRLISVGNCPMLEVKEALPLNAPEVRGKAVDLRLYVDSDHAGDPLTRRSWTGCMLETRNCRNHHEHVEG